MRKLLGSMVLCFGLFAGSAQADISKLYFGVGLGDGGAEVNGSDERTLGTINGTVGLQLLNFVGVELQLGASSDDAQSVFTEAQVAYGAAMIRLGLRYGQIGAYVLGGQAFLDSVSSINFSESGEAVGVGLNLFGDDTTSLNIHFLRLDDGAYTNASIGFQYYFGGYR